MAAKASGEEPHGIRARIRMTFCLENPVAVIR